MVTKNTLWFTRKIPVAIKWLFLIIISLIILFPLYWGFITSFKPLSEVVVKPPLFFPENSVGLSNYREVIDRIPIITYYRNSLIVATIVTLSKLFTGSLAGFIYAKYEFPGKNISFFLILITMMIPFQVIAIPVYLLFNDLNLIDTLGALIIPNLISGFGIYLLRQYIKTIPNELLDAARIDGCSEFRIYWNVVLPQCKPALAALAILSFNRSWDDFFWPILALESQSNFTLPFGLHTFGSFMGLSFYTHILMAATMMAVIPVLIAFLFAQKQFIEGLTLTGMKG